MARADFFELNRDGIAVDISLGHRWFTALQSFRYALAAALVTIALAFTLALHHFEPGRPTLFMFFAATAVSAWYGGIRAGAFAAALSVPASLYFYSATMQTPTAEPIQIGLEEIFLIVCFAICAAAGNFLNVRQRSTQESLRCAHERLKQKAEQLQRLNNALQGEVSERRATELALREARAHLARVSCLTSMGELAASIAHEVNQPLTAIATNAGTCLSWLEQANLPEAKKAANRIIGNAAQASGIIDRVRNMLKPEHNKHQSLNINAVIEDVLSLIQHDIQKQRIAVHTNLNRELPTVRGDRVQLQQLFLNLFLNAVEAMTATHDRVRTLNICSRLEAGRIVVSVQDTGPGIAQDVAHRIFDAFVTTKASGMGLGLAVCKSVVETHGGALTMTPGTADGAAFEVSLPQQSSRP